MPYRERFDCLWCGRAASATSEADLTGWASLCADCLGRAADNAFLRFRLRAALRERSAPVGVGPVAPASLPSDPVVPGSDDWYLRRGVASRGPIDDLAWNVELDRATVWLDGLPFRGEIVELAAGSGWWSPLLAQKGELSLYAIDPASLEQARERLVAHRLRAHLHTRDPWSEPDRTVDGVFSAVWLSQISSDRLPGFLGLVRRWLRPGGVAAFIDPLSALHTSDTTIDPLGVLAETLGRTGFADIQVESTGQFFRMASAAIPSGPDASQVSQPPDRS